MSAFFAALPAALGTTLLVTIVSLVIGCLAAFPLMLARVSENALLANFAKLIIEIIRGVPPVVWVFVIYFGIQIGAFRFDPLPTAIIAFSLITAAYIAEVYRGGFLAVSSGQFEAAAAIGLSKSRTFIDVISPQMIRVAIPGVVTYAVGLLKDTSIMSIIGVVDIVFVASRAMRATGDAITPFLIAALLYMVISIPLGLLGRRLYTSMKKKVA